MVVDIDHERCIQCETCVHECPRKALKLAEGKVEYNPRRCFVCGHCLAVCPRDAILIDGAGYNCEDVEDLTYAQIPNKYQMRNMILARRSCRRFTDDPVTEEELGFLLEAARYAPTGMNRQGNAILAVTGKKVKELTADTMAVYRKMLDAGAFDETSAKIFASICMAYEGRGEDGLFFNAPLVIIVFADTDTDGAIAAANIGYTAQANQLGYCFARLPIRAFEDPEYAEKWQAPKGKKCVIVLNIGNPEPEYFSSVPRKELSVRIIN